MTTENFSDDFKRIYGFCISGKSFLCSEFVVDNPLYQYGIEVMKQDLKKFKGKYEYREVMEKVNDDLWVLNVEFQKSKNSGLPTIEVV